MTATGNINITLVSTSIVKPASHEEAPIHSQRIELTPWDLQLLLYGHIQVGLLFLKPTTTQDNDHDHVTNNNLSIHDMKKALSRTLDFFYPLAGRLGTEKHDKDGTSSYFIICDDSGAEFTHAVADNVTVSHVIDPLFVPAPFFRLNGLQNFQGVSNPLLAVQVTELVDGIFIAATVNHMLVDGVSFCHLMNFWLGLFGHKGSDSEFIRDYPPPLHRRFFLDGTVPPIRLDLSNEMLSPPPPPPSPPFFIERVFHFKKGKIAALKVKANAETTGANISSLQAFLALIWRSVIRSRLIVDPKQELQYQFNIGCRTRISPPLPITYFGNSLHKAAVTMTADELLEKGLGHVALKMNETVASQTDEKVRNFQESWMKNPSFLNVRGKGRDNKYTLSIAGSPSFNVYADFGWGTPVAARSGPSNKFDGRVTVIPGKEEGSVSIELCLLRDTLEALMNDPEFMDAVTV